MDFRKEECYSLRSYLNVIQLFILKGNLIQLGKGYMN